MDEEAVAVAFRQAFLRSWEQRVGGDPWDGTPPNAWERVPEHLKAPWLAGARAVVELTSPAAAARTEGAPS